MPETAEQLYARAAAIWDDVLPPLPDAVWRANLRAVAAALAAGAR